jgi:hypothetical protein
MTAPDKKELEAAAEAFLKAARGVVMVAVTANADDSGYSFCMYGKGVVDEEVMKFMTSLKEMIVQIMNSLGTVDPASFEDYGPLHGKEAPQQ